MAAFQKFNIFVQDLGRKVHDLNSDVLKIMLTNVVPLATNAVKADITEITPQSGYVAGGVTVATTTYVQANGVAKLAATADPIFSATGGSFGPFRYAVLYNSTPAAGPLIGWWDYGIGIPLNNGDTFTVDLDQTNGILTLV